MMCEAMKWNHLPVEGGLYDQHPDLLDGFMVIFAERSQHEAEEAEREKQNSKRGGKGARVAGRRR